MISTAFRLRAAPLGFGDDDSKSGLLILRDEAPDMPGDTPPCT